MHVFFFKFEGKKNYFEDLVTAGRTIFKPILKEECRLLGCYAVWLL
jgi:hypothetical protein